MNHSFVFRLKTNWILKKNIFIQIKNILKSTKKYLQKIKPLIVHLQKVKINICYNYTTCTFNLLWSNDTMIQCRYIFYSNLFCRENNNQIKTIKFTSFPVFSHFWKIWKPKSWTFFPFDVQKFQKRSYFFLYYSK